MGVAGDFPQVHRHGLPFFPTTSPADVKTAKQLTFHAVQSYFYLSTTKAACHTCCERARNLVAERHVLQLDIVAVVYVRHVHAHLVVLFRLHAFRERHRLRLYLSERVESLNGLDAFVGRHDGGEAAVGIVGEFLHSHAASEPATAGKLAGVIEEIAVPFVVGHSAVVRERLGVAQRHDFAGIGPRSGRGGCRAVADMLWHTACCIQQLVGSVPFRQPWALHVGVLVLLSLFALVHRWRPEGLLRHRKHAQLAFVAYHVAVQLQVVDAGVAPHQPCLAVVVDKHSGVDVVPAAVFIERFAQCVAERPGWAVAHCHADGHAL